MTLEINKAFKSVMAQKSVSGVELAKRLGCGSSTITNNIGKGANPTLKTLQRYCGCLGVNVSEVILIAEKIKKDNEND